MDGPVSVTDLAEQQGLRALATGKREKKPVKQVKRGLLSASRPDPERRTVVTQDYAIDEFKELPARKKAANRMARENGHMMRGWHRRPNDPFGRWNCYCDKCNRIAVVCTEPVENLAMVYGTAIAEKCK